MEQAAANLKKISTETWLVHTFNNVENERWKEGNRRKKQNK